MPAPGWSAWRPATATMGNRTPVRTGCKHTGGCSVRAWWGPGYSIVRCMGGALLPGRRPGLRAARDAPTTRACSGVEQEQGIGTYTLGDPPFHRSEAVISVRDQPTGLRRPFAKQTGDRLTM